MKQYLINGPTRLKGEIAVKGAKNHALKVIAAAILTQGENLISNLPQIQDVKKMLLILESLGAKVNQKGSQLFVSTDYIQRTTLPADLATSLRASIILSGPMLARFKKVTFPYPGGCSIGRRPIDIFLEGLRAFGARLQENKNGYTLKTDQIKGTNYFFPKISVTATETFIMTATLAQGRTVLKNCAQEPEIVALADYLNSCGAKIKGAGTSTIVIEGVKQLKAGKTKIIPDRIEAGTFIVMGLLTKSQIKITNCEPKHLESFLESLKRAGADLEIGENYIITKSTSGLRPVNITTHEYPGFPTDLQAPFTLLMTQAQGISLIHDPIFEGRLFFTDKLNQMGANIIMCDPHRVIVQGPTPLVGKKVDSPDLRAGATLLLAGLIAQGQTTINNIYQIERGYEDIVGRLKKLGADIEIR